MGFLGYSSEQLATLSTRIIGQTDFYPVDGNLTKYSNSMEASCMTYVVNILVTYSDGVGWQVVAHSPCYFNLFYYI